MVRLFPIHPLPNVGRAVQQLETPILTADQEPHRFDIDQRHFLQIQHGLECWGLEVVFQTRQLVRLHPSNQADHRFYLERSLDAEHHTS